MIVACGSQIERVPPLLQRDDDRLRPDEGDRGDLLVHAGPDQAEVVDVGLVRDGDRVRCRP